MRRCHVVDVGPADGRPFLLLPGNDLGAEFYAPLAEVMARAGARVRCLTLPGWDQVPPLVPVSWPAMVAAVADELEPGTTVVGHSLGGLLALQVAAAHPAPMVERLVLLEPAVPPGRRAAAYAAKRYDADVVSGSRAAFENWSGTFWRVADERRFPAWAIAHYERVRRTSDVKTARTLVRTMPDLYPLPFSRIQQPVHVLRGERSGWWARVNATYLSMKLPNIRVTAASNLAHWMANEDDERLAELILC